MFTASGWEEELDCFIHLMVSGFAGVIALLDLAGRVDYVDLARGEPCAEVGQGVCVPVPEPANERVVLESENAPQVIQASDLELLGLFVDHLPFEGFYCVLGRKEHGSFGQWGAVLSNSRKEVSSLV